MKEPIRIKRKTIAHLMSQSPLPMHQDCRLCPHGPGFLAHSQIAIMAKATSETPRLSEKRISPGATACQMHAVTNKSNGNLISFPKLIQTIPLVYHHPKSFGKIRTPSRNPAPNRRIRMMTLRFPIPIHLPAGNLFFPP